MQLYQKTIQNPVSCTGIGVHTGVTVTTRFVPASENHGIVFRRIDVQGKDQIIPARWDYVVDTRLSTTIANKDGVGVQTIEHIMAALAGLGIDNLLIEIDGPETPVMDGSSAPFIALLESAGLQSQMAKRKYLKIRQKVVVQHEGQEIVLQPFDGFKGQYDFDFKGRNTLPAQTFKITNLQGEFKNDLAAARTFGFYSDVEQLRAAGFARGGSLDNAVVLEGDKVLNPEGFRYPEECARHKLLDAIGDLYLAGYPLQGSLHSQQGGHMLNHKMVQAIFADARNYSIEALNLSKPTASGSLRSSGQRIAAAPSVA
jgi:UDP-3-O-[3-hydroxymyristoyl] N-acetylglucosamine deacetylase